VQKLIQKQDYLGTKVVSTIVVLIGIIAFVATLYVVFQSVQNSSKKKHRIALANFELEVFDGINLSSSTWPKEIEDRMIERLPQLEALASSAPRSDGGMTDRVLASWRIQLDRPDSSLPQPSDAWSRLFLGQRFIALGDAKSAQDVVAPLRKSANPNKAWATVFWSNLIGIDQLQGDRNQGWKDLAEYKAKFKQQANPALEHMIAGI
jgi:hypothetical protein